MEDSEDGEAEVSASPEYFTAEIHFNLDKLKTKKSAHAAIVHELLHVVLSPYTQVAKNLVIKKDRKLLNFTEERLVSVIEKWKLWNKL
jgi:hypothetical protein